MQVARGVRRSALSRRSRGAGPEVGASAVEFALIVPILIMLVFGIIQFGLAMSQKASLANGAREGARVGAVNLVGTHTCGEVVSTARKNAVTLGVSETQVAVKVERLSAAGAASLVCSAAAGAGTPGVSTSPCTNAAVSAATEQRVRVTTELLGRSISIPGLPGAPLTLRATGEFRCEYH